jgi:hypothetical protein
VLQLRVFGPAGAIADLADGLEQIPGCRHVIHAGDGRAGRAIVTVDLGDDAVDRAIDQVNRLGLPPEDVILVRLDSTRSVARSQPVLLPASFGSTS